jgi:hypothetical protein
VSKQIRLLHHKLLHALHYQLRCGGIFAAVSTGVSIIAIVRDLGLLPPVLALAATSEALALIVGKCYSVIDPAYHANHVPWILFPMHHQAVCVLKSGRRVAVSPHSEVILEVFWELPI